jgi:hypothetical protein
MCEGRIGFCAFEKPESKKRLSLVMRHDTRCFKTASLWTRPMSAMQRVDPMPFGHRSRQDTARFV